MEKKIPRNIQAACKGNSPDFKKNQDVCGSNWESASGSLATNKNEPQHRSIPPRFNRNFDKRPRLRDSSNEGNGSVLGRTETTRVAINNSHDEFQAELGSVFLPGSKKQIQNQILNFVYPPVGGEDRAVGLHQNRANNKNLKVTRKHQYNKEQFLQANCQFVVNASGNYKQYMSNPDALVDWNLIEQINAQVSEFPSCPICLQAPIAAKMTRCGHIYCWSCMLHYLSLSVKTWSKCPICFEAVHKKDLKSVIGIVYKTLNIGDVITFKLMKRPKGSLTSYPANIILPINQTNGMLKMCENDTNVYSKLLLANNNDILKIINREYTELKQQLIDNEQCSEYYFIEYALKLLGEREKQLIENFNDEFHCLDLNESNSVEIEQISVNNLTDTNMVDNNQQEQTKFYYFYQASDGQHIYLHALNAQMLEYTYGSLENSPPTVTGKILEKEDGSMTKELRKRMRCLQHLPVTCQFEVAEIELKTPVVSKETIQFFKDQLEARSQLRQRRAKEEKKREKRIAAEEDRIMGKSAAIVMPNFHIDSQLQFPDFESSVRSEHYSSDGNSSKEPTPANSLSKEMEYQGPSFAKMLASNAKKLNTDIKSNLKPCTPSLRLINVTGADMKSNLAMAYNAISDSETENAEFDNVPSCNRKLGDEIFKALQKAEEGEPTNEHGSCSGKKKKKKNKQKLLFTTSVAYFNN